MYGDPRNPPPFPTRRSSDLRRLQAHGRSGADALRRERGAAAPADAGRPALGRRAVAARRRPAAQTDVGRVDRESTSLKSSHAHISYAGFCFKKKKKKNKIKN